MDVFDLRRRLIAQYSEYIRSFIRISDPRIGEKVERECGAEVLWPDPLVQLNPAFEPGSTIDERRTLHPYLREGSVGPVSPDEVPNQAMGLSRRRKGT